MHAYYKKVPQYQVNIWSALFLTHLFFHWILYLGLWQNYRKPLYIRLKNCFCNISYCIVYAVAISKLTSFRVSKLVVGDLSNRYQGTKIIFFTFWSRAKCRMAMRTAFGPSMRWFFSPDMGQKEHKNYKF
jgi:hypothetical protein